MVLRNKRGISCRQNKKSRSKLMFSGVLIAAFSVGACYGLWKSPFVFGPKEAGTSTQQLKSQAQAPKYKKALEFAMTDLDHGWIRYEDGVVATSDGGRSWLESDADPGKVQPQEPPAAAAELWMLHTPPTATSLQFREHSYSIKQSRFMTDRIGWALVNDDGEAGGKLFVTIDGGVTWQTDMSSVSEALEQEKQLIQLRQEEASRYASVEDAKNILRSAWVLMPGTVKQGDAVLVRHDQPGEIEWQGKKYTLQPSGAGYFTYLPVGVNVKPGEYPIGDKRLTVREQSFPKQYLQVTEELDSMRQDTKRIDADQAKIDAARGRSQPEFLFTSSFMKPIEGILTTPYGHMRYVNGKLSGSHLALDLAAKQGTPIHASNDGIVALADSLYLTGNSIYIDHGMGLFSQYAHLSELRVKTGDRVKKGDIIGLVGTTGFSTGPHLHFTFWAHNVPVNPNVYFDTTPFLWRDPS